MKIMQMARFESISPIKIGLNVTEYENNITIQLGFGLAGFWQQQKIMNLLETYM